MNPRIKDIIRQAFHSSGAIAAVRKFERRSLRILLYHHFSMDTARLREQCEHIRRCYHPVTLTSIGQSLKTGEPLPANSVAITVDDGYRDFFLYGYPVFRDSNLPVTIYLVSEFLDQQSWLWWDKLAYSFQITTEQSLSVTWPGGHKQDFIITTREQRRRAYEEVREYLKKVGNDDRLTLLDQIPKRLHVGIPPSPPPEWSPLCWDEVRQMSREGIEFGAHTKSHPILSSISDVAKIQDEIAGCKARIEEELGQTILHFSYPNGTLADISKQSVEAVIQAGFCTAVTAERGLNSRNTDPFLLRRVAVEPDGATYYFQELLAGIVDGRGVEARRCSLQ